MKIGIISDSHKKVGLTNDAIEFLKNENAEYLVHAGDLVIEDNLKLLKNSGLPYISVFGNNDAGLLHLSQKYSIKKEPYYFMIEGYKFKLMHLPFYMSGDDADVIIYGHLHEFEHEFKNGKLFLNPGELCARNKPISEFVLLEISDSEYIINYYFKNKNEKNYKKDEIRYGKR